MKIGLVVGKSCVLAGWVLLSVGGARVAGAQKSAVGAPVKGPWMNTALDPDTRADMMIKEMTLDEKIQLVGGVRCGRARMFRRRTTEVQGLYRVFLGWDCRM
jgi:hypothetical protein